MNIVVTGGKGFIGTYVVNELVDTHAVTILDNGFRESQLPISKNIKIVDGNITDYNLVSNVVNGCDVVIHLAGISQVMTSIKHPSLTFEYNIRGTENIARSCCETGVKLLFSSSREVYGTQEHLPVKTDAELNNGLKKIKTIKNDPFPLLYPVFHYSIIPIAELSSVIRVICEICGFNYKATATTQKKL